ncbi:MAG: PilZ domain-containing protein [Thermodesulforhabdaceae bacterium]|jgi:Tfp pilus assembly protein PilZ
MAQMKPLQIAVYVEDELYPGTSTNFGPNGILILMEKPPMLGEKVRLKIHFPDVPTPVEVKGEVVWTNPFGGGDPAVPKGCGVKFTGLSPDLQSLLSTMAFKYNPQGDPLKFFYS